MNESIHQLTQLLVSSWILGGPSRRIPTTHGILDRALKQVSDEGLLPDWARESLHFVVSRTGLQCVEVPAILDWAQTIELTAAPNPSYRFTEAMVSRQVARQLVRELKVSNEDAIKLGKRIRALIESQQPHQDTRQRASECRSSS